MDVEEVRRILFSRVQSSDAENAFKIMGYLLLQDWAEQELFMLALGSEEVLHAMVSKARMELGLHMNSSSSSSNKAGGWSRAVQQGSGGGHSHGHGSFGTGGQFLTLEGGQSQGQGQSQSQSQSQSHSHSHSQGQLTFEPTVGPRQLGFDAGSGSPVMAVGPAGQLSPMAATPPPPPPPSSSAAAAAEGQLNSPMMMMMMASTATDSMVSFYNNSNHNLGSNYNTTIGLPLPPPKPNGSIGTRPIIPYPHTSQQWCTSSHSNALAPPTLPPSSVLSLFNEKTPTFNYAMASEEHHLLHQHSSSFFKLHHSSSSINNSNNNNNNNSNNSSNNNMSSITRSCLFFSRGYCKHGNTCRFSHHVDGPDRYNANMASLHADVEVDSSGSDDGYSFAQQLGFESFEMELRELLKGKKVPVSIASLPQMYYERFGKSLQAEGYLTESQRHGKAGFSLTRLLMRLKGTVRLIERPHGQHAVMLLEEGLHLSNEGGRRGPEDLIDSMNASSRQIYLTFPAESSFSEEDVTIHFRAYGPVQDVRIPHQQKRMFGFVTFIYPDTVRTILTEGNPHYICGARVLVKPYKEKGKKSSSGLVHKERQDIHLILQEERLNIELPVVEQKLGQLEMSGNEPKGEAVMNPIGTKLDTSDFDLSGDIAHDGSLLSSNFKYVLDLLEGENKDVEISDSSMVAVSGTNSKALNLKLGVTDNNTTDTVTATSLQKVRSNLWSTQNTHTGQYGWGATTLFARDVF